MNYVCRYQNIIYQGVNDDIGGSMSSRENVTSHERGLPEDPAGPPANYHLHLAWLKSHNLGPKAEADLHFDVTSVQFP